MKFAWVFFLLTGCVLSSPPRNSRFKADITGMEQSHKYKNTWVYRHQTRKVTDYTSFMIAPVMVYPNPASKIRDRTLFDAMERRATQKVWEVMKRSYAIAVTPSSSTLIMQVAIQDIKPIVALKDAGGNDTIRTDTSIEGSKMEVDFIDSMDNERVFALSTLYEGEVFAAYKDPGAIDQVEEAYQEWAGFFKARLDEAMKKKKAPKH